MRSSEIRELSPEEIELKLEDLREELFNLRYKAVTSHMENVRRIRVVKRIIARMLTILQEKQNAALEGTKEATA